MRLLARANSRDQVLRVSQAKLLDAESLAVPHCDRSAIEHCRIQLLRYRRIGGAELPDVGYAGALPLTFTRSPSCTISPSQLLLIIPF